jgi:hypothetical protein
VLSRTFTNSTRHFTNFITERKNIFSKNKTLLDYVLEQSKTDERPFVHIEIMGYKMLALLDSGANRTILGGTGWEILSTIGLIPDKHRRPQCTVANGKSIQSLGTLTLPIRLKDKVAVIDVLIVPDVPHTLILGVDFWKSVGIIPDVFRGEFTFAKVDVATTSIESPTLSSRDDLTWEQKHELDNLIESHFTNANDIGKAIGVEHKIVTSSEPIKQRYYPVSPVIQKHIDVELDKMLKEGVIERSKSAWSSPILLVKKKDGNYRFCVDFRKLNKVTERDAYPLPYVASILDRLRDARFITSLDIKSAYWQIPMAESSKPYTAFTVPNRGLFQFTRMPFGLHNAPATWQRLVDGILGPELEPYVFVYLDDVIICTDTYEQHMEVLKEVLKRLKESGLTLGKDKCNFCKPEMRYLGYVINSSGLLVDPEKVNAILRIPPPKSVGEVRRIIGMASWYRRFIPNFSTLIGPLTSLLKKNKKFVWDEFCDVAFSSIKDHLVSAPVLSCPDFNLPFTVQTDASGFGIGAVLSQTIDGEEHVICYISRSLAKNERMFSVTERECLAVLWSIEKLGPFLEGTRFSVITDHHSLVWLNKLEKPSGRLCRWAVKLQQYDFEIIHRKGKEHVVPDALSRSVPILDEILVTETPTESTINTRTDRWYATMCQRVRDKPLTYPNWKIEDTRLLKYTKSYYPDLREDVDHWKEVVPKPRRSEILKCCHDEPTAGHLGILKTYERIAQKYYWPKLKYDVVRYLRRCKTCISHKPEQRRPAGLMTRHPIVTKPWQMISTDLVGPLPRSSKGYAYILVVADCFTKFALFIPLRAATAAAVTRHIEEDVILMFGAPQYILCDNGVQYRSKEFRKMVSSYKSRIIFNAHYHPQANPTERINRVMKTMLSSYVNDNQRVWDRYLAKVAYAARSAVHEVTGITPYFANFSREPTLDGTAFGHTDDSDTLDDIKVANRDSLLNRSAALGQLYEDIVKRLDIAYQKSKTRYDLRRRPANFCVGDTVWRRNFALSDAAKYFNAKLAPKFLGPFYIRKKVSSATYELSDASGIAKGTWHAKDLKLVPNTE